jgi:hypothetical protein
MCIKVLTSPIAFAFCQALLDSRSFLSFINVVAARLVVYQHQATKREGTLCRLVKSRCLQWERLQGTLALKLHALGTKQEVSAPLFERVRNVCIYLVRVVSSARVACCAFSVVLFLLSTSKSFARPRTAVCALLTAVRALKGIRLVDN